MSTIRIITGDPLKAYLGDSARANRARRAAHDEAIRLSHGLPPGDGRSLAERVADDGFGRDALTKARASLRPPRRDEANPLLYASEVPRAVRMSMAEPAPDDGGNPLLARLLACRPELRQCVPPRPVRLSNGDLGYPDPETACVLIVEALARHGISLPPFVHARNLRPTLLAALHALDGADDEDRDDQGDVYGFGDEGDYTVTV